MGRYGGDSGMVLRQEARQGQRVLRTGSHRDGEMVVGLGRESWHSALFTSWKPLQMFRDKLKTEVLSEL